MVLGILEVVLEVLAAKSSRQEGPKLVIMEPLFLRLYNAFLKVYESFVNLS